MEDFGEASSLIGHLLGVGLLGALVDNGTLTPQQAEDLADDALSALEEFQSLYPDHRHAFESARKHLDKLVEGLRKSPLRSAARSRGPRKPPPTLRDRPSRP